MEVYTFFKGHQFRLIARVNLPLVQQQETDFHSEVGFLFPRSLFSGKWSRNLAKHYEIGSKRIFKNAVLRRSPTTRPTNILIRWLVYIRCSAKCGDVRLLPIGKSGGTAFLNLIINTHLRNFMIQAFTKKVIISGHEVEYYEYKSKPVLRGYSRRLRQSKKEKSEEKEQTEKTKFSVNRTRTEIRRRVNDNPQLMKFLTLTTTLTDIGKTNRLFNLYTQRMKDRFPEFQYLAVPEFQKDIDFFGNVKPDGGAVHYHLLCNLRYVRSKEIAEIWNNGFINIRRVDRASNLGRYICKYLQKDMFDKRMFRKKKYFCSQDLARSLELIQERATFFLEATEKERALALEKTFFNEYSGEVSYKLYYLKDEVI